MLCDSLQTGVTLSSDVSERFVCLHEPDTRVPRITNALLVSLRYSAVIVTDPVAGICSDYVCAKGQKGDGCYDENDCSSDDGMSKEIFSHLRSSIHDYIPAASCDWPSSSSPNGVCSCDDYDGGLLDISVGL